MTARRSIKKLRRQGRLIICAKTGLNGTELERAIRYAIRQAAMTAALRQSQQQLELFMRSVPCAVCIRDGDGDSSVSE